MQEQCPELLKWWITHQDRTDIVKTALIIEQEQRLKTWVNELLSQQTAPCQFCDNIDTRRINPDRPQFVCRNCGRAFNLLSNTPFDRMRYPHSWAEYIDRIANGESHHDIHRVMGFSTRNLAYWKRKFLCQMKIMGLNELIHWIEWQESRRKNEVAKHNRPY